MHVSERNGYGTIPNLKALLNRVVTGSKLCPSLGSEDGADFYRFLCPGFGPLLFAA